ncbi:DUF4919 domain-containing protein [Pontibacter sp. E15-1]|uniref:DUF4919 domain-containing protein n=1 Tax=Pontibacter sp. E15-1 TaxID=2919918 RepID=UPI001F4F6278|nr:DUF4919 domain-containing protein [Pontibacter sp. E15-1]MCJ8165911.1 DUF4919 domain-containing protein [Pontibacter sp. E15-1]
MKATLSILLLALLTLSSSGQDFDFTYHSDYPTVLARTQAKTDKLYYPKQVKRFVQNDPSLTDFEVLALMIGFTAEKQYDAYGDLDTERAIYKLNDTGKHREAVRKGRSFNKTHPLHQMTLIELSFAYHQLQKPDSSAYFGRQFQRIMDAMALSGSGLHPDSALFSLTPVDGQNFIRKYLDADIGTMGSNTDKHGHFLDVLEYVSQEDGAKLPLYFNIEHASKQLKKQLREKNAKAQVQQPKTKSQ